MIDDHSLEDCEKCSANGKCPIQQMLKASEYFEKMINSEGERMLDRMFRRPNIFKLVQDYEILDLVGEVFDLKEGYYNAMLAGMSPIARERFERILLLGDRVTLAIRALILQRADQLVMGAIDGICARDGVCYKCWLAEVCKAKAEKG